MKSEKVQQYVMIGLTAFCVIAASLLTAFLLFHFQTIRSAIELLTKILMPFIIGCVIAYLLSPFYNLLLRNIESGLSDSRLLSKRAHSIAVVLSVAFSISTALLLVSGLVALVVPGFVSSLTGIVNSMQLYSAQINKWVNSLFADSPETASTVQKWLDTGSDQLMNWVRVSILPNLQNLSRGVGSGVSSVFSTLFSGIIVVFNVAKNVLVGFIVAAYLLVGKTTMIAHAKRMLFALFKIPTANRVIMHFRYVHQVFGGFIRGKLLDSLVIGVLCFIGSSLLKMPYVMLISVIIGVTNIIPFFGPFLGAIPCACLVLLNSPIKCVTFIIFVIALQQFDGNILGPKILGNTTGLSSFWVLFSILLFGGLFGVVGMIIGVPVFAVLVSLLDSFLADRLKKKHLSTEEEDYLNLHQVEPQPDGTIRYSKLRDPTKKYN